MAYGIIYVITCKLNGKQYVGQTINTVEKRFNEHSQKNSVIGNAIRKYGKENFRCEALKHCESKEDLDAWEKFFIAALHCKAPFGYNLTDGGEGVVGRKHTDEELMKISMANTGKSRPSNTCKKISIAQTGEKNHNYGKHITKSACAKMSIANRGNSSFKNLLREIDKRQLTYTSLAKLLGLSISSISLKMLGKQNFTARDKVWLEKFFGKPIEYLLERDDG